MNEIIKYIIEQSSGIVIALLLIIRIESKLDDLSTALVRLAENIAKESVKS